MMIIEKCPSKTEFAKAVSGTKSDVIARHLAICPQCAKEWSAHRAIQEVARHLPRQAVSPSKTEADRVTLQNRISGKHPQTTIIRRYVRWMAAASVLTLLIAAFFWGLSQKRNFDEMPVSRVEAQSEVTRRASVNPFGAAEYRSISTQPDEMIRVFDGTISITVDKLSAGERFRVITGDAEIEVVGTVFEVSASRDKLVSVRVLSGMVEVRPQDRPGAVLEQGERWLASDANPISTLERDRSEETANRPAETNPASQTKRKRTPATIDIFKTIQETAPSSGTTESPDSLDAETRFNQGWRHYRQGNFAAAAESFEAVLIANKDNPLLEDAAYWCAVAHARTGNQHRSEATMQRYLSGYPNGERAKDIATRLGWIRLKKGNLDSAETLFRDGRTALDPKVRRSAERGIERIEHTRRSQLPSAHSPTNQK
jgi:TolA-binding protein